ncbi:MAG: beta-galactosidase [Kiritimatiellae bacterium]|nr:beta-galactosidase [Kiritimatiellia bacterium]
MKYSCMLAGVLAAAGMAMPVDAQTVSAALDGAISIKSQEAVVDVPLVAVTSAVPWAKGPVVIDGDLAEWKQGGAAPNVVMAGEKHASWFKGAYGGPQDLSASVWLGRDDKSLYLALEIADDRPPAAERIHLAFADADTKLIVGWQDVGRRVLADDVGLFFVLKPNGTVEQRWTHPQRRMDQQTIQNSFGTETERRVFLESVGADASFGAKIFSKMTRKMDGGKSVTQFEAAFPWKYLTPYDPVSYRPLKFNLFVEDTDEDAAGKGVGAIGWMPGMHGVYSAAHFPTLTFTPPTGRQMLDGYAQLPAFHYVNQDIVPTFSFYNPGSERRGKLELFDREAMGKPLATAPNVMIGAGYSRQTLAVHSESVGKTKVGLMGRLTLEGSPVLQIPVHAPRIDDTITIQPLAEVQAKIATLRRNATTLSNLFEKVKAKGLDTAYPRAYLTLQQMFIPISELHLQTGATDRVLKNTETLEQLYARSKAYMEEILKDPKAQLKVPPRFDPDKLKMKKGYWWADGKPVFLWGPCVFWYLKEDQPRVWELGFNSIVPEVGRLDPTNQAALEHLDAWYKHGVSMNAAMSVPDLQLTGADVRASKLLKEHPELKNLDPNNFMSFLVQHPLVREKIVEGFNTSIAFWRRIPGVKSYWLWNEPWYVNYSETTRKDFIEQYLKPRYKTIEALNVRWKSGYKNFDEIKLITWPDPKNTAPWYDFQQFRDVLLADFWSFLDKTAKRIDASKPTHTKFMASSLHAFDIEQFQSFYDIAGHDGNAGDTDIPFLDFCSSIHPDKPLVNTEIHIWYGGRTMVANVPWRLALHGLADGNWWCWHSDYRFSDSRDNAESMWALSIAGLDVQRLFHPHIYALNKKPRQVATLFPDVVERRSDLSMVRRRFELATAQYPLGLHPFYVTEKTLLEGALDKRKLLLAGESDFVKDGTYQGVLDYVKHGGTAIVVKGGFARNEYGDPRDTGELIKTEGGEPYAEGARTYPLGKGRVICLDSVTNKFDVVENGGQCLGSGAAEPARRKAYQRVLAKALVDNGLVDAVRLVPADDAGNALEALSDFRIEWRVAEVEGGYTMAVLAPEDCGNVKLSSAKPIKRIVNLITGKDLKPKDFALDYGPNLFRIELK